jgi:hypothetical protein
MANRFEQARQEANAQVDSLQNLSPKQREHVRAIALGYIESHSGQQIHYENVANHVRGMAEDLAETVIASSK